MRLFPYRVRVHPNGHLGLIGQACLPAADTPCNPNRILNSRKVFELENREVSGYNLLFKSGVNDVAESARKSLGISGLFEEVPIACVAGPYTGTVTISAPEVVHILRFD